LLVTRYLALRGCCRWVNALCLPIMGWFMAAKGPLLGEEEEAEQGCACSQRVA